MTEMLRTTETAESSGFEYLRLQAQIRPIDDRPVVHVPSDFPLRRTSRLLKITADIPIGAPAWISRNILIKTRAVWTLHLDRLISAAEAVEMLQRVRRLTKLVVGDLEAKY